MFSASSCAFKNGQCQTAYGPYFFVRSGTSWSRVDAFFDYEFACAGGDQKTFFFSDGSNLFAHQVGSPEVLLFNGTASQVRFQDLHCDKNSPQVVYFAGYDNSDTSFIWKYDGSASSKLSVVAKNPENWHITSFAWKN